MNALSIKPSTLLNDLISYKAANPNLGAEEFVKVANQMLDKQGFNYDFVFDENTCQAIAAARKKQNDPSKPLNLNAKLNSVAGDQTSLVLPRESSDQSECGRCFVNLPVWEATEKDFVTFIHGINVKFYLPANFTLNEIALVDNRDLATVIRRWKVPFRAEPISISDEGKILYLALPDKQLGDLAIMIFDEGIIQFYARKDVDPKKTGTLLKEFPREAANPNLSFISFDNRETKQILRFTRSCAN